MAELGKAYVQIIPSSKGISGSIQNIIGPEAAAAGKNGGLKLAQNMSKSMQKVGKTLTKSITLPAVGAATAVGGIVSALGWKRLTGLDAAKAQLKGLGYEAESVERISSLVSDAIQGTVTTMAEGVSVAAGALAAGVDEGKDLERYIKLVGDAAVGAGRSTGEMAQIFNRVQGSGRLMTKELNMIEQGMPGFAQTMANSLGVSQAEFRNMVTQGKISSAEFLDVMEDFAGDMSDAYAESWEGIVSRTKSNVGILGETMLGGVFEESKEVVADFLEYIRTDEVREWAKETGQAIGETFRNLIQSVKDAIDWWQNLDDGSKKLIKTIALIAIAAGPVITIIGKIIGVVLTAIKIFGALKSGIALLGVAFGAITAPIAIAIAAVAAMIAVGVALWKNWDTIKEKASQLWEGVKETFGKIKDSIANAMNGARDAVKNAIDRIKSFFNFKWSLPKLKLPRIAIEGKFSLVPPSVPRFTIKWNKEGAIFKKPTIFGTNQGFQGVGEAGMEAVLPISKLSGILADTLNRMEKNKASGDAEGYINHSGTIRVEGVNNRGELTSVVDIVMAELRREART